MSFITNCLRRVWPPYDKAVQIISVGCAIRIDNTLLTNTIVILAGRAWAGMNILSNKESQSHSGQQAASWETYWQGTGDVGAYSSGGVSHPAIQAFWDEFFRLAGQDYAAPRIVDIASGNGAVVERSRAVLGTERSEVTSVDVSAAAIENIRSRFPEVHGIVADARSIPLDSAGFDIVTSQFGVEYAGVSAIEEATRLVAANGRLALLLHSKASSIHKECEESLDAIAQLRESQFIRMLPDVSGWFRSHVVNRPRPYEAAPTQLAPQYGARVNHGAVRQHVAAYHAPSTDVDKIHRGIRVTSLPRPSTVKQDERRTG